MRKRTVRILTGVAVIMLALGLSYAVAMAVGAAKLRRAYAALQADKRPMHRTYILPHEVVDTNNAALLYRSAASLLKAEPTRYSIKGPPHESVKEAIERERNKDLLGQLGSLSTDLAQGTLSPEKHQELKELMGYKAVEYALFAIEQGTQRPACLFRHERDYDAGNYIALPELLDMKGLACIVGAKARLEAEAGAMGEAWHLAGVQAKMAEMYRYEPILISQMIRLSLINLACETIQRLCESALPGREQQEQLESALRAFDDVTPMVRAVDGERLLLGEWLFSRPKKELRKVLRDMTSGDSFTPEYTIWLTARRLTFKPSFLADHANYLRIMQEGAESFHRPYSPVTAKERYAPSSLTGMFTPAFGRTRILHCQMTAETRITRAGLALLQYRAAHGAFPATLDALNLDGLSDPFIQGPLHYRAEGGGFIIYSVGEDQTDDGGTLRPERRNPDPRKQRDKRSDILWRFPGQMRPTTQ